MDAADDSEGNRCSAGMAGFASPARLPSQLAQQGHMLQGLQEHSDTQRPGFSASCMHTKALQPLQHHHTMCIHQHTVLP